ncbi:unnamed protein product, partial [Scytosiphon promiscuus]
MACLLGMANILVFRMGSFGSLISFLMVGLVNLLALFLLMQFAQLSLLLSVLFCLLPGLIVGLFFSSILFLLADPKQPDDLFLISFPVKKGKKLVINIKRALGIFGAMGAGKTRSGFVPVIFHCAKKRLPILCYDDKEKELAAWVNSAY